MRPSRVSYGSMAMTRRALNGEVEEVDDSAEDWTVERITFDAAYGDERMMAFLFLPKRGTPPYQTVVYFPDRWVLHGSRESIRTRGFDFLIKDGRAFLFPVYKSTFDRQDGHRGHGRDETNRYKETVIMWGADLRRSIDYLETRDEIDIDNLAYLGTGWGGVLAPIMLAIEDRFKTGVLELAGLSYRRTLTEVEPIQYLPRVTIPVLMMNGRHDFVRPLETSQQPFYDFLGTPEPDKDWILFDAGHDLSLTDFRRESLAWLDRYLGPVQ